MNRIERIAMMVAGKSVLFKEVVIGGLFYDGISKGMGANSGETHITFFEKIDKTGARVVKADWAPRQVGAINKFGPNSRAWVVEDLPDYDTRTGYRG